MPSLYDNFQYNDLKSICVYRGIRQGAHAKRAKLVSLLERQDEEGRAYEMWDKGYLRLEYDHRKLPQFDSRLSQESVATVLREDDKKHSYTPPPLTRYEEIISGDEDDDDNDDDDGGGDNNSGDGTRSQGSGPSRPSLRPQATVESEEETTGPPPKRIFKTAVAHKRQALLTPISRGQTEAPTYELPELPEQAPMTPISRGQTEPPTQHEQPAQAPLASNSRGQADPQRQAGRSVQPSLGKHTRGTPSPPEAPVAKKPEQERPGDDTAMTSNERPPGLTEQESRTIQAEIEAKRVWSETFEWKKRLVDLITNVIEMRTKVKELEEGLSQSDIRTARRTSQEISKIIADLSQAIEAESQTRSRLATDAEAAYREFEPDENEDARPLLNVDHDFRAFQTSLDSMRAAEERTRAYVETAVSETPTEDELDDLAYRDIQACLAQVLEALLEMQRAQSRSERASLEAGRAKEVEYASGRSLLVKKAEKDAQVAMNKAYDNRSTIISLCHRAKEMKLDSMGARKALKHADDSSKRAGAYLREMEEALESVKRASKAAEEAVTKLRRPTHAQASETDQYSEMSWAEIESELRRRGADVPHSNGDESVKAAFGRSWLRSLDNLPELAPENTREFNWEQYFAELEYIAPYTEGTKNANRPKEGWTPYGPFENHKSRWVKIRHPKTGRITDAFIRCLSKKNQLLVECHGGTKEPTSTGFILPVATYRDERKAFSIHMSKKEAEVEYGFADDLKGLSMTQVDTLNSIIFFFLRDDGSLTRAVDCIVLLRLREINELNFNAQGKLFTRSLLEAACGSAMKYWITGKWPTSQYKNAKKAREDWKAERAETERKRNEELAR